MNYENKSLKQLINARTIVEADYEHFKKIESDKYFAKLVAIDKAIKLKEQLALKKYCDKMMQGKTKKNKP